ncbi:APC family permease [Dinghuibacter silviterrae]|uniref:APC family permease n=1 Tax=Dinghuibacter silviterrae TaxID=1539049 RepID=UPI0013C2DD81|nr:APC family permease [Dinghuibacter silviterrae]
MTNAPPTKKLLRPLALVAVIFFTVSGGPYGMEPLLGYGGHGGSLLILLLTPLFWDIPTMLAVLELNAMMPVGGGYYQWVKRGLGLRWAFFEGWWTWLYTFVDLAIYPVLFVQYACWFLPGLAAWKIPICLGLIWSCAGLNILGVVPVGRASLILGTAVLIPFIILFGLGLYHLGPAAYAFTPLSLKGVGFSAAGMGCYTVMWNMLGWDNTSTYADQVERPARSYVVSMGIAFVLVLLVYVATLMTARGSGIGADVLRDNGFPALGVLVGGRVLGILLAAGGMASAVGLFAAVLLSVAQVPKAMADDRLLPSKLSALSPRFGTPARSIVVCAGVVSVMILWTFMDLVVIDITLYGAALFLEFITLVVLRIREPGTPRSFRVPLNVTGLCVLFVLPVGIYLFALNGALTDSGSAWKPAIFALVLLVSAEIAWQGVRWKRAQTRKMDYI